VQDGFHLEILSAALCFEPSLVTMHL
jgi:hypothetical protein